MDQNVAGNQTVGTPSVARSYVKVKYCAALDNGAVKDR